MELLDIFEIIKIKSDLPCDNCIYDVFCGCCDYPGDSNDYCILGDKQIPIK